MTRPWCVLLVGALCLPAAGAPRSRPAGKVVRVERNRGTTAIPRVCDVRPSGAGTCIGTEPVPGELIVVLDETGMIAQVRILQATGYSTGGPIACDSLWAIKTELVRGDLSNVALRAVGVVDPELQPRKARVLAKERYPAAPSGRPDEHVVVAVDRDGDREPDIVLTQSSCDGSGSFVGGACVDQYSRIAGRLVRIQHSSFANCGL
jgi:hypothetical protein